MPSIPAMHVVADVCIVPLGQGTSVSKEIKRCEEIFQELGVTHHLHAYGTNLEGDWEEVLGAIKRCHEVLHQEGVVRLSTSIKIGTRTDKHQTIAGKIQAAQ